METIQFARLISWISAACNRHLQLHEVEDLHAMTRPPAVVDHSKAVIDMCNAMASSRKLDAIKLYRNITGMGLKEGKDAIEAAMSPKPYAPPTHHAVGDPATTIGDWVGR